MFGKGNKKDGKQAAAEAVGPTKVKAPKAEKAPTAPKALKEVKVKKVKKAKGISGKAAPNIFALHVEKLVLAIAALAVGYFIYAGLSAPGYSTAQDPQALKQKADSLMNQIKEDHWAEIESEPERDTKATSYLSDTERSRKATDAQAYTPSRGFVWDPPPVVQVFEKRKDPKVFPAENLVVKNVWGALAIEVPNDAPDPFDEVKFENAPAIEAPRARASARGGTGGRGRGGYGGEGGMGFPGEEGNEMQNGAADEDKEVIRHLSGDYDLGVQFGSVADMGGGMMGGGMPGGGMPGGGMPGFGGGNASNKGGLGEGRDKGPKVKVASKPVIFNAITALVPHKKMADEYDAAFVDTGTFMPQRDVPYYLSFEVQRVDVTADPNRAIAEGEWGKPIFDAGQQSKLWEREKWAIKPPLGMPVPEVIDANAWSMGLTMPIPPMLVRDYRPFSKHPSIGWSWDYKPLVAAQTQAKEDGAKDDTAEDDGQPFLPGAGGAPGMPQGGMPGGMSGEPGGMGGMAGYGGDMGGMAGYGGDMGGMGDYDGGMMPGMGGEGDMGYGGGYGGYGSNSAANTPQPEFKMVRCYDMLRFSEIGKVYRYRVRLMMRDPNYPEDPRLWPEPNELSDDVWARVAPIKSKDDASIAQNDKAQRTFLRTAWSEPSNPVLVQAPYEVVGGAVDFDGPRKFVQSGKSVELATTEQEGQLLLAALDPQTGATYSFEEVVRRGTVLNKEFDAEIVVPTSKVIKLRKNFVMNSEAVVADIRGGQTLAGDSRNDPLISNGEYMVLMRDGRVEIASELDDMFLHRLYTFANEKEKGTPQPGGGMGGGVGGGMGGKGPGL